MKYLRHSIFLHLLALSLISGYAQEHSISGTVWDGESGAPIPFLTVYVNGSTTGTITDQTGKFELTSMALPCNLVFSHISYELQLITLRERSDLSEMRVQLSRKIFPLREATVIHNSVREKYLERFKGWFLGPDYAEVNAEILNDSILIFITLEEDEFEAYANEPLVIFLPESGYMVKTDLVHFRLQKIKELNGYHASTLGYFFFEDIEANTRRRHKQMMRNRAAAYYNSRLHFCRSLYDNALAENGYQFDRNCFDEDESAAMEFLKPDYTFWYEDQSAGKPILHLTGFACPIFKLAHYQKVGNRPIDLTYLYPHPGNAVSSGLVFTQDTVHIFSTGRVAENSILFQGAMGDKGVAWMLPDDYIPSSR